MEFIKLANTIGALAKKFYVPFEGFQEDLIYTEVSKHLVVSRHEVLCALEIVAERG